MPFLGFIDHVERVYIRCDGELKENKLTREAKTEEVNALTAKVDELNAQVRRVGGLPETAVQATQIIRNS